jgi:hypothetical protein
VSTSCTDFRARLAQALVDRSARDAERFDGGLAWHEHVLTCAECRELLDSEEALEDLLASLPLPSLPPELARRVLQRLQPARAEVELDRLLDDALLSSEEGAQPPPEFARDVLARLSGARELARREAASEHALDALLDRVPTPGAPAGLPSRMLKALAPHRERIEVQAQRVPLKIGHAQSGHAQSAHPLLKSVASASAPRPTSRPTSRQASTTLGGRFSRPLLAAAAVLVLAVGVAWLWTRNSKPNTAPSGVERDFASRDSASSKTVVRVDSPSEQQVATPRGSEVEVPLEAPKSAEVQGAPLDLTEPDAELLAQLELLESWELLTDESLDFELVGIDGDALLGLTTSTTTHALDGDASDEGGASKEPAPKTETRNG